MARLLSNSNNSELGHQVIPFQWDLEIYVVMFDHEQQAHEFFPVADFNEEDQDFYFGNINLITV